MSTLISRLFVFIFFTSVALQAQTKNNGSIQFIRNATTIINYGGYKILVDPMLSPKGGLISVAGKQNSPLVDLPIPISEIVENLDLVLVTHNHFDHFDSDAVKNLNKKTKLLHQPADRDTIQKLGFQNAETIYNEIVWKDIKITRVIAEHGTGRIHQMMGDASGFVLQAKNQPTIYVIGDAVWTEGIYQNIKRYEPDYIIVNTGGAKINGFEATPIIMDEKQAMSLVQESGKAVVIAVHMDAIDHCYTTREILKKEADKFKISSEKLLIPNDGEIIEF
ncbi:putative Zn-dependent hydrolase of the beta-lactamase fold [Myroides sp. A21]|uniref:MBL fold metallo-hydrolase n=1 Tax=Myroides sp. A21 TaxID=1583100 RepID=UPI00058621ED|nr:MBL fold metallo-hydrolase [Myroides sp. A21]AJA67395.1 putative Zn-dependent hydrolase of the beta-lactamase fold [Myroides sp. A21]